MIYDSLELTFNKIIVFKLDHVIQDFIAGEEIF